MNDFTQVSPDRSSKDVGTLKQALQSAESITLPNRVRLYDLYHDVTSFDGRLSGLLEKRTAFVLNKRLHFMRSGERVDEMEGLIGSAKFGLLMELLMETVYWGCMGVEFVVGREFDFVEIPRKHIRVERGVVVKSQYDVDGIPYADNPNVWVVGEPYDFGKLLQCSVYALYKRSGFADFAQYVEIFGQPVRIIYYDAHDTKTKGELDKMLRDMGAALTMMIPKQAQFEMMDGKNANGTGELQMRLIDACNDEMSIAILGVTETTSASRSSGYAQAREHGRQQLEITKSDIRYIEGLLNSERFMKILSGYGYPVEGGKFVFEKEADVKELSARLAIDERVATHVTVDDDYWYDTYGVPKGDKRGKSKTQPTDKKGVGGRDDRQGKATGVQKGSDKGLKGLVNRFFGKAPAEGEFGGADSDF